MSHEQYAGETPTIEEMAARRDEIMALPGFERIDAVKTGQVYITDIAAANGSPSWLSCSIMLNGSILTSSKISILGQFIRICYRSISIWTPGNKTVYPDSPIELKAVSESISTTTAENGTIIFSHL